MYVNVLETRNLMVKFVFQMELSFTQNKFKQFVAIHQRRNKLRQIVKRFLGIVEWTMGIASIWVLRRVDGWIVAEFQLGFRNPSFNWRPAVYKGTGPLGKQGGGDGEVRWCGGKAQGRPRWAAALVKVEACACRWVPCSFGCRHVS